jgi:hypothetical protein
VVWRGPQWRRGEGRCTVLPRMLLCGLVSTGCVAWCSEGRCFVLHCSAGYCSILYGVAGEARRSIVEQSTARCGMVSRCYVVWNCEELRTLAKRCPVKYGYARYAKGLCFLAGRAGVKRASAWQGSSRPGMARRSTVRPCFARLAAAE